MMKQFRRVQPCMTLGNMVFLWALLFVFIFVRVTFIPAAILIGFWFLIQLFNLGSVATAQTGGVAYVAHVAGAVFGALTARFFQGPKWLAAQL